tara:strand:- start:1779 stop:2342 length:564 start_codon:yes stop_codon:yes gene_type:complete
MFSGKTSKILSLSKQYDKVGVKSVIVNHASDLRYSTDNELVAHDGSRKNCVMAGELYAFHDPSTPSDVSVFLINEGQFFPDIVKWTHEMVSSPNSKKVFISGLDADYRAEPFGDWLDLVPFADSIEKLSSVCAVCKENNSVFSMRVVDARGQVLVGTSEYMPACRRCFENSTIKELKLQVTNVTRYV